MSYRDFRRFNSKIIDSGDNIKNFKINKFKCFVADRGDNKVGTVNENFENVGPIKKNYGYLVRDEINNGIRKTKEAKSNVVNKKDDRTRASDLRILSNAERKDTESKGNAAETRNHPKTRVPVIKSITKNETKAYSVAFIEPKQTKTLDIKIPSVTGKRSKIPKLINRKLKSSKTNIKYKNRRVSSPVLVKKASPETEVAKWSPSSKHTKSYYEAWLNYEAISRNFKSKVERENLLKLREFARCESPELIYKKLEDVNFTGRIKVNHR